MEEYKPRFSSIFSAALFLSAFVIMATGQDFDAARKKINTTKPNINYTTFCTETPSGQDKIACRINGIPSVGFLVCKYPKLEGEPCKDVIDTELGNIQKLGNANVKTVTVSPPAIHDVKCGTASNKNCSGFLEGWVDKNDGQFKHVRNRISNGTVDELIKEVKALTTSGLTTTANDLAKIKSFMVLDVAENEYQQICDLQGFFLVKGGFLVGDTPSIQNVSINASCWTGEPETNEVLSALDTMINAFKLDEPYNDATQHTFKTCKMYIYLHIFNVIFCLLLASY